MMEQKRIRDYGINVGTMKTGAKNSITDVKGVKVGHHTIHHGNIHTGVTAILPHEGSLFQQKVMAASYVINGFGKTTGTIQIDELGSIETPIVLTNTLSVGTAHQAVVEYMLIRNQDIGDTTGTVNPIICECNDGYLNDIRGLHISKEHIFQALETASEDFEEGAVGAGSGMICYGLKGGIGSASRVLQLDEGEYSLGVLVLSNFGRKVDLLIDGIRAGEAIKQQEQEQLLSKDKGSVIIVMATDLPLSNRQLKRVCKRAAAGLSRTGTHFGSGSGDIVVGFSTANQISHYEKRSFVDVRVLHENKLDEVFRSVIEATEEAVLNSMICADTTLGRNNRTIYSLREYMKDLI